MDATDVDPTALDHAMRHLEIINQLLNGYGPSIAGIRQLLPASQKSFSLLDVGCGSGDTLRHVARWSRKHGYQARLTGIELSEQSANRAAEACRDFPEIHIRSQNLFDIPAHEQYDITHCALVLHHFSRDEDAVQVLVKMGETARLGIIVNDSHRHWAAYWAIWTLTRLFSRSSILQNDAPLSVARSFTRSELLDYTKRAGFQHVNVQWHWAFRWLVVAGLTKESHSSIGENSGAG